MTGLERELETETKVGAPDAELRPNRWSQQVLKAQKVLKSRRAPQTQRSLPTGSVRSPEQRGVLRLHPLCLLHSFLQQRRHSGAMSLAPPLERSDCLLYTSDAADE